MSKQEKVAVAFVKHWRGYNPKEVAAFPADHAERLVAGGVAEKIGATAPGRTASRAGSGGARQAKAVAAASGVQSDNAPGGSADEGFPGAGAQLPDDERP